MKKADFLIVGGGLAGAKAAETLRKEGAEAPITLICAEPHLPYHRPPLSKGLLLGYDKVENIFAHNRDFYQDNDIQVVLGTRIAGVDGLENLALDTGGNEYGFGKLLVATGSRLRRLPVPGENLKNVFYLRTLDDSQAILRAMNAAKDRHADEARAVVIGAGFIGMELVSAFAQNDIKAAMLVRSDKLFDKLGSDQLSRYFLDYYRERGVEIIFNDSASHFEGDDQGRIEKIVTATGRVLPADIVSIGIGVEPETGFLADSGLEIANGVIVDEYLRSPGRPDVFAAGDIANFYDPVFGKHRRIEHWDNAIKQGDLAGRNMLGAGEPHNMISYFYSDLFDISWEFIGDNSDIDETVVSGSFEEESAIIYYLKESRLKAAFLLMQTPKERKEAEKWILSGNDFSDIKANFSTDPTKRAA